MTGGVRVILNNGGEQLTVRELIAVLVETDLDLPVGVRREDATGEDQSYPALNVLLDEDAVTGTWVVLE